MRITIIATLALALILTAAGGVGRADELPGRGQWVPSWTITYGGYRQVEDLVAPAIDEAWGVDSTETSVPGGGRQEQTAIVRYSGGVWRTAQIVDGVGLEAIDVYEQRIGFAVGSGGALYRLRDDVWRALGSPTDNRLRDVSIGSATSAWAVGDTATLLFWDGKQWEASKSPIRGVSFRAVDSISANDAWAVAVSGEILRWQSGAWTVWPDVRAFEPQDIGFAAPDRGLIIGRGIHEWRGTSWQEVASPYGRCDSLAWVGPIAYLACDNELVSFDNGSWSEIDLSSSKVPLEDMVFQNVVPAPGGAWGLAADGTTVFIENGQATFARPETSELLALDMVDTELGWAGGKSTTAGFVGAVDGSWSRSQSMAQGMVVGALAMASADDGWAVGREPGDVLQARMWRWDGSLWKRWSIDKTWEITDIQILDADEGWAGRGNVMVRWDGEAWRHVAGAPAQAVHGGLSVLRGGDDPEGWFGGFGGIHHLVAGEWHWEPLSDFDEQRLLVYEVEVPDPNEGWAITSEALYRYDGTSWEREPLPTRPRAAYLDIDAPERGNAWVLVQPDGLFHWSGFAWEYHTLSPMGDAFRPSRLEALRLDPESLSTDVWLVGRSPSIGLYRVVTPASTIHLPHLSNASRMQR